VCVCVCVHTLLIVSLIHVKPEGANTEKE